MKCHKCHGYGRVTFVNNAHSLSMGSKQCDKCKGDGLEKSSPITKSAWDDIESYDTSRNTKTSGEINYMATLSNLIKKISKYESELKRIPAKEDL